MIDLIIAILILAFIVFVFFRIEDYLERNSRYKNKIALLERENFEKQKEIDSLMEIIEGRGDYRLYNEPLKTGKK